MKRLGGLIWCHGLRGTRRHLQGYIIRADASLSYLMRHPQYQILYGRQRKAPLLTLIPKYFGAYSVIRPATPEGSVSVFLVNDIPRNGGRSKSIAVKSRSPIKTKSTRGSRRMAKIVTLSEFVSGASFHALVRWSSYHRRMLQHQPEGNRTLNPLMRW